MGRRPPADDIRVVFCSCELAIKTAAPAHAKKTYPVSATAIGPYWPNRVIYTSAFLSSFVPVARSEKQAQAP